MDGHAYASIEGMMEPVALQGQNLIVHYLARILYRTVEYLEPIPPFQVIDVGALAAATVSPRTQMPRLDMPDDEIGQFRWWVLDNAQIRIFLPTGIAKSELKTVQTVFDKNTPIRDPDLTSSEIFIWEDNRPAIEAINGMDYALTAVRIVAMGYRFYTTEATRAQEAAMKQGQATHIWCTGRGQGLSA